MRQLVSVLAALAAIAPAVATPTPALAAPESASCDRFAAASGDDGAPGSSDRPLRTVVALMAGLAPGQVGCLRPGDSFHTVAYLRQSGTAQAPITLTSGPGPGRAVLTGQLAFEGSHTRIRGLAFAGLGIVAATYPKTAHLLINGDDVQLLDNDITSPKGICVDVGDIDGFAPGTVENGTTIQRADDLVVAGNRIHDCGVQNFTDGDFTTADSGIHGLYLVYTRRAVIRDNLITGVIDRGIQLWPRNEDTLIEHNTLDGNGSNVNIGSSAPYGHFATGTVVRDNIVTNALMRSATTPGFPHGDDAQIVGFFPDDADRGNRVVDNCIFGDFPADLDFLGRGFSTAGNLRVDPLYVDRALGDLRVHTDSPCAGKGARVAGTPAPAPAQPAVDGPQPEAPVAPPTALQRPAAPIQGMAPVSAARPRALRHRRIIVRVRVLYLGLRGPPAGRGVSVRIRCSGSCVVHLAVMLGGRTIAAGSLGRRGRGSWVVTLPLTQAGVQLAPSETTRHATLSIRSSGASFRAPIALPQRP